MQDNPSEPLALFIGIDWADREHEAYTIDPQGQGTPETIEHTPEAIEAWVTAKLRQAQGRPIAILVEQTRGALIHALMFRKNVVLYPINPKQFAHYRKSYSNAGCKDDLSDARLLAQMLAERHRQMRAWQPDDEATRTLARLCQARRGLVQQRTRLVQQLTDHMKGYFPLLLELNPQRSVDSLMLELVRRWPDPRQLRRADPRILHQVLKEHGYSNDGQRRTLIQRIRSAKLLTEDRALIEPASVVVQSLARQIPILQKSIAQLDAKIEAEMQDHPDAPLFQQLPGAGKALAPRLLTAFGSQRDRFASADDVATFSGIAPVTKQSGRSKTVHRRYACSKYIRQSFHEFAEHARRWCPWSRAYYRQQRSRGMKHHAALRKLASRWIRILFRVWKTRTPYDQDAYLATLKKKNPDIIPFLETAKNPA